MRIELAEDDRRKATLGLAWAGWVGTGVLVILRATELVPMAWGSVAILTIGVAIAASLARSRMRLTDTIVGVFEVGVNAANDEREALREEVRTIAELVETLPTTITQQEDAVATYEPEGETV